MDDTSSGKRHAEAALGQGASANAQRRRPGRSLGARGRRDLAAAAESGWNASPAAAALAGSGPGAADHPVAAAALADRQRRRARRAGRSPPWAPASRSWRCWPRRWPAPASPTPTGPASTPPGSSRAPWRSATAWCCSCAPWRCSRSTRHLALLASAVSGSAAALTLGWLVPMTAVCALALAAATLTRSANVGVAAGLAGWVITVLAAQAATGRLDAAVTASGLVLPYLVFAACCAAVVLVSTRIPRGAS